MAKKFFQPTIPLALVGLMIIAGVLIAQYIDRNTLKVTDDSLPTGKQAVITNITLASLADPTKQAALDPPLRQNSTYSTNDLLALRITTRSDITSPVEVNARLLTDKGVVVELDPPSFSVTPGVSTFCCWQVQEVGTFTLQLFRPEGFVTSLPLKIRKASGSQPRTFNL